MRDDLEQHYNARHRAIKTSGGLSDFAPIFVVRIAYSSLEAASAEPPKVI
jgi:hypothetical protein